MNMTINPKRMKNANKLKKKFFELRDQMVDVLLQIEDELGPLAKPFVEYSVTHFSEFFTIGKPTLELLIEYALYCYPEGLTVNEITEVLIEEFDYDPGDVKLRDVVYQIVHASKRVEKAGLKGRDNVYCLKSLTQKKNQ